MNSLLKWFLAAAVVLIVVTMLAAPAAEAGWRVHAYGGYPAYYGPRVYPSPYVGTPYWGPPIRLYPAPVVVPGPVLRPVYRPMWIPRPAPYWAW